MSAHTEAHPAQSRLFADRVVVLGYDYNDARLVAQRHPALRGVEYTAVSGMGHPGGFVGLAVGTVYITPDAHRAQNYDEARRVLKRSLAKSAGEMIHLTNEGGTYGVL